MTRAFTFVPPKNPQPLGQMLDVQAARDPQRPALTCGSTTLTRGELALRARARALALQKLGVQAWMTGADAAAFMEIEGRADMLEVSPGRIGKRTRGS